MDEQINQRSNSIMSEYVCELIRRDVDRLHLRGLLLDGAASAPAAAADAIYFDTLRKRAAA